MTILDGIPFAAAATLVPGDFAVFDLFSVRLYGVFPRAWAPAGVAVLPLADGRDQVREELEVLERRQGVSVLVLRRDDALAVSELLDLLDGFALDRLFWASLGPAGRLETNAGPVRDRERTPRRYTFVLHGAQRLHLDAETLPLTVSVTSANAQADGWVLGIEGGDGLPEAAWFQLPEAGHGTMAVGIVPSFDADRWQMWLSGGARPLPARKLAGVPFRPSAKAPFRLSLIFDRTAVDPLHWGAARSLQSKILDGEEPVIGAWNAGWRRVLASFLSTLPEDIEVDLWWFADLPGHGAGWPGRWPGPERCVGTLGRFAPAQASREVEALGWVPGLDIWDGLDLALTEVSERIAAVPSCRHGVLIVGNSPPPPSARPGPAWARLRDAVGGHVRRQGNWEECVASLVSRCGVAFVPVPLGDGAAPESALCHFQALLREALEQDGVFVTPQEGTLDRSLTVALDYLRSHVASALKVTP